MSLRVASGSLCAIIGPSGAGKTTLLRATAGLVAHAGTVAVGGVDMTNTPTHQRGVAMVFQEPRLFATMTVLDNVAYPDRVRRIARRTRQAKAKLLLDEVGLGDRANSYPHDLSGGEQHRVALARALNAQPQVLLLDEPLTGLDAPRRAEMRRLIAGVQRARRLTTLYVSHDLGDAVAVAESIAVIIAGRLEQHGPPALVLDQPATPEVARLTGNPNLLWDGTRRFTIRPEHVVITQDGIPMRLIARERRVAYDELCLDSPWGLLYAAVPAGFGATAGDEVRADLPASRRWSFARAGSTRADGSAGEPPIHEDSYQRAL